MSEFRECKALAQWAAYSESRYPELAFLTHNPFGENRNKITGSRLKAMGTKRGFPDYSLLVARNDYHGLFIEMKAASGRLNDHQKAWKENLLNEGYQYIIAYGWQEAADYIEMYLNGYQPDVAA